MPILEAAKRNGVFINFDVESHATKDLTIELFKRCCGAVDFDAGLAMQAYLKSGDADARDLIAWAKREGRVVTVRLVKGAYWDYETIHAEQMGWPVPVWATKRETDACFERDDAGVHRLDARGSCRSCFSTTRGGRRNGRRAEARPTGRRQSSRWDRTTSAASPSASPS